MPCELLSSFDRSKSYIISSGAVVAGEALRRLFDNGGEGERGVCMVVQLWVQCPEHIHPEHALTLIHTDPVIFIHAAAGIRSIYQINQYLVRYVYFPRITSIF